MIVKFYFWLESTVLLHPLRYESGAFFTYLLHVLTPINQLLLIKVINKEWRMHILGSDYLVNIMSYIWFSQLDEIIKILFSNLKMFQNVAHIKNVIN